MYVNVWWSQLWWCNSPILPLHSFTVNVVLELEGDMHVSQQSLINFFNKSESLQILSLEEVQLSDMVSHPWDVCNVTSVNCISLYYMYRMRRLLLGISVEVSSNTRTSQMWHWWGAVVNSPEEWLKDWQTISIYPSLKWKVRLFHHPRHSRSTQHIYNNALLGRAWVSLTYLTSCNSKISV